MRRACVNTLGSGGEAMELTAECCEFTKNLQSSKGSLMYMVSDELSYQKILGFNKSFLCSLRQHIY